MRRQELSKENMAGDIIGHIKSLMTLSAAISGASLFFIPSSYCVWSIRSLFVFVSLRIGVDAFIQMHKAINESEFNHFRFALAVAWLFIASFLLSSPFFLITTGTDYIYRGP